ncbi:MAG: S46 family peptidase [Planctomycetaceae bacterium]
MHVSSGFVMRLASALPVVLAVAATSRGDEGMWLFSAPPLDRIERQHGVRLDAAWLTHLRHASVRFSSGGSGSFVSPDGLVLTNHHVGADAIQKLGSAADDLLRAGFMAATRAAERKCHDLELNVLVSIEDVTRRVESAVPAGLGPEAAFAARRAEMATIEQESLSATGLRSDVVTLYHGGAYHLYRSKRYTDVRLVFAPEQQIAFFGGDADNFEFPRYNLDVCLFRVYEDGRPVRVEHHLRCAAASVADGELIFVSGHPGHTDRAATVAELVSLRDRRLPLDLRMLNRLEVAVGAYAAQGPEERRQATQDLRGVENGRKARSGVLAGLLDPRIMAAKRDAERVLRSQLVERDEAGSPFDRIERAQQVLDGVLERHRLLEGAAAFNTEYFRNARTVLRATTERQKPSGDRLREYRDSNLGPLELQLFSEEPLHDAFETVKLADSLTMLAAMLGADDPLVVEVLDGQPPAERAAALVAGTDLGRRAVPEGRADRRRELYDGGAAAVASSADPMVMLARTVDGEARRLRVIAEAAEEEKKQAHAEITRQRFAREGLSLYPDATFTLRLAYGVVRGGERLGAIHPAATSFQGLFTRADEKLETHPFDLPPRWREARGRLEADPGFMTTAFNFASTADIIGGNSGSPVVNAACELVGVIFDGNIDSLVLDVAYDDDRARAVAVDAQGIIAALTHVYRADTLVQELMAGDEAAR